ncbi:TetR/AcrR family transcriptional regulator [Paracoccus pacificus]|uniref:TetR/AcrR family transcriptional regulator n=1 Tax=Paracoccus pacificus TaxID=1463598 RepID=A0ABW4R3A4_9RHOB
MSAPATSPRHFRRVAADERRAGLIEATLDCVAEHGLRGTTLREVAARAGVTNGLIRHHFDNKEQLLLAAYRHTIDRLTVPGRAALARADLPPHARLGLFVAANLGGAVVDPRMFSLWANFISMIHADPAIGAVHRDGYLGFREQVEPLIADVLSAEGRPAGPERCRALAIAVNALLDGLWLEGSMLSSDFAGGEVVALGVNGVASLMGVTLEIPKEE